MTEPSGNEAAAKQRAAENEAAAKQVAADKELSDKSKEEFAARMKGKPTPTQEENDLAAHGQHFDKHEPDGSDPDPNVKQSEATKPTAGGYQTRQATPATAGTRHPTHTAHSRSDE